MSQIAQIRNEYNNTTIEAIFQPCTYVNINGGENKANGIKMDEGFTPNKCYYFDFKFVRKKGVTSSAIVSIKLCHSKGKDTGYIILEKFKIVGTALNKKFTFIAPPSNYDTLVFEIAESEEDVYIDVVPSEEKWTYAVNIYEIGNIITDNKKVIQLGIQAKAGFSFIINNELIQIGKTNIFETPENYIVDFIGIATTNNSYILDYKYNN